MSHIDDSPDPWGALARNAMPGAAAALQTGANRRRLDAHERRGRVDGMVVRAQYVEQLGEVTTAATTYQDLGGPSATVAIPAGGGFVEVYTELEGASGDAFATLVGLRIILSDVDLIQHTTVGYKALASAPGPPSLEVVPGQGGPVRFFTPITGPLSVRLVYKKTSGVAGKWRNRRMLVGVCGLGTSG
jgi:hypothetical protein